MAAVSLGYIESISRPCGLSQFVNLYEKQVMLLSGMRLL